MAFPRVIKASGVPDGGVAKAVVNKRELAIIHRGGDFFALDGVCTHEGGPLGEGTTDREELVCPWHEGLYTIRTGEANPGADWVTDIKSFPVKVQDGYVWVDL